MKQKIVLKVLMRCPKCRVQAFKAVAETKGDIESYRFEGDEREYVVVVGEGVDIVGMANKLSKKVGKTDLVSVTNAGE